MADTTQIYIILKVISIFTGNYASLLNPYKSCQYLCPRHAGHLMVGSNCVNVAGFNLGPSLYQRLRFLVLAMLYSQQEYVFSLLFWTQQQYGSLSKIVQ